jgi:hypothetical protein
VVLWEDFLITDVESQLNQHLYKEVKKSIAGQSIVEFVLSLPILIGLVIILIKINIAIQISIVNQQYARAQILFLTFNSNFYPEVSRQIDLMDHGVNRFTVGVSDNIQLDTGSVTPKATEQTITRTRQPGGTNNSKEDSPLRAKVRIRNTVTLCTPTLSMLSGGAIVPILSLANSSPYMANGRNHLNAGMSFCGGQVKYE